MTTRFGPHPLLIVLLAASAAACPKSSGPEPGPAADAAAPAVVYRWAPAEASPQPELLHTLMNQFYDLDLLLSVTSGKGKATVVIASSRDGQLQDRCAATTTVELQPGSFSASVDRITFAAKGLQASLHAAELAGAVGTSELALEQVRGLVDTRELLPLVGPGPDDALCAMMVTGMGECVPCPDGQARCWAVSFSDGVATPVQAEVVPQVVPRTAEEVCGDPACVGVPACNGG